MESMTRPEAKFSWFIPIDGDGAHIGTVRAERPPTFEYLSEVVRTAEDEGFYSLLIPTRFANGLFDEGEPLAETWTTATALAAVTSRIRFLIAVRPGFISPGLFAQMAATLDRISGGRIDINVVPGGIQGDFERLGEASDHAHRYARAEEFIAACRTLWESPEPKTFEGEHVRLNGGAMLAGAGRQRAEILSRRRVGRRAEAGRQAVGRLSRLDTAARSPGAVFRPRKGPVLRGRTHPFLRTAHPPSRPRHRGGGVAGG